MSQLFVVMPWHGTFAGGASAALTAIAHAFRRSGHDVSILTTCSRSPYEDWQNCVHEPGMVLDNGIEVRRFAVDRRDASGYHMAVRRRLDGQEVDEGLQEAFFEQGINSRALIDFVAKLPAAARVLVGPYYQSLTPSLVNACPGRVSVMPAFHDEPEIRWQPIRRMVANARELLFLSEDEKALAIRVHGAAGGRRLVEAPVVGLGVSLPPPLRRPGSLESASLVARVRRVLPERYFIYCGRIEWGKGLDYLIPWFQRWAKLRATEGAEPVPLVLIGGGNFDIVPRSPEFMPLGFVGEEEKFGLMRAAAALINPSRVESFSYVVMESWLSGRPVIVPAECAVTAGHVRRCGGGAVFGDETAFRRALQLTLDEAEAARLGEKGRRYAAANYRWPDVMDRMLAALGMRAGA